MPQSDWSQFLPSFIVGLILLVVPTVTAFMFKGFRDWASKTVDKIPQIAQAAVKLAQKFWSYSLALFILIISPIIFFGITKNIEYTGIFSAGIGISMLALELALGLPIMFPKKNRSFFHSLYLTPEVSNSKLSSKYIDPPKGALYSESRVVAHVFQNESLIFDTFEQINSYHSREDGSKVIAAPVKVQYTNIRNVFILINSSNSLTIYKNKKIGEIRLTFEDAPPLVVDLILGHNIRESLIGSQGSLVREASSQDTGIYWKGVNKDGVTAIIDYLKIPIFNTLKNNRLVLIEFVHTPTRPSPEILDAHFSIFGISLQVDE